MRALWLILSLLATAAATNGQNRAVHLSIAAGAIYPGAMAASVALEVTGKYHSAYEGGFSVHHATGQAVNYLAGVYYKPVLVRNKNTLVRYRFGGQAGTDLTRFIGAPVVGIELVQALSSRFDLTVSNTNGYYFNAAPATRWRIGAAVGGRLRF